MSREALLAYMRDCNLDAAFDRAEPASIEELQAQMDERDRMRAEKKPLTAATEDQGDADPSVLRKISGAARTSYHRDVPPQAQKRVLKMSAIFNNLEIQTKYKMDVKTLALWRNNAKENPHEVVSDMQDFVRRQGFPLVTVQLDSMKGFETEAIYRLKVDAEMLPRSTAIIRVDVPPRHGSSFVLNSPEDEDWELSVDYANLPTAMHVWRLCEKFGPAQVSLKYGVDLSLLHIHLTSLEGRPYLDYVEPHAATDRGVVDFVDLGLGPADARFFPLSSVVRPLMANVGVAAFAISIGNGAWLVNEHVVKGDAAIKFHGRPLSKCGFVPVFGPMNVMMTHVSAPAAMYRAPEAGEIVRMIACNSTGPPLMSPPLVVSYVDKKFSVSSVDDRFVFQASPGMSGAAYVAERDLALVGIHEGYSVRNGVIMLPIQPSVIMSASQAVASSAYGIVSSAMGISKVWTPEVARLKRYPEHRDRLNAIFERVKTLNGRSVWSTPIGSIEASKNIGDRSDSVASIFSPSGLRIADTEEKPGTVSSRRPVEGEMVILVGAAEQTISVSQPLKVLAAAGSGFLLQLPDAVSSSLVRSFVVVSLDGAQVVGWVSPSTTMSLEGKTQVFVVPALTTEEVLSSREPSSSEESRLSASSYSLTGMKEPTVLQIRDYLHDVFPYLSVQIYDSELLEEAFTHRSRQSYSHASSVFAANRYLARCGDAILSERFMWYCRERGIPDERATVLKTSIQTNAVQADVVARLGMTKLYRCGVHAIPIAQHAAADLLEALAYLVYIYENADVFKRFLTHVSMLPTIAQMHPAG